MTKSIIRIAILVSLFMAAVFCILSEPTGEARWFFDFLVSKCLGVICIWALARLYPKWSRDDKWVAKYNEWCMRGADKQRFQNGSKAMINHKLGSIKS